LQKLSIFKLKFSESRRNRNRKNKDQSGKSSIVKTKDVAVDINDDTKVTNTNSALNSSSFPSNNTLANDNASDIVDIEDPILYFKRLDKIINKVYIILYIYK